jgi:DNA-binding NarL/FixJ family response regulator
LTVVAIIDPLPLTAEATAEALELDADLPVAWFGDDPAGLLAADAGVGIIVIQGWDRAASVATVRAAQSALPDTRLLLVAPAADHRLLSEAIAAGVDGFITAGDSLSELVQAVRLLAEGAAVIPPHMLGTLLRDLVARNARADEAARLFAKLTPREREVLELLVDGCDHVAAAGRLFISPETAKTHIQNTITKLGVHSRLAAAALAVEYGLVERRT